MIYTALKEEIVNLVRELKIREFREVHHHNEKLLRPGEFFVGWFKGSEHSFEGSEKGIITLLEFN